MHRKKVCLVINPRAGENIAKLSDVIAVLAAAGWSTDIAIKQYGGQTLELATKAAEKGYDLVLAYGGDGTLNQVVNGVMNVKGQRSTVGIIPGGTANVWAGEIGVPVDPVKSALALVTSEIRKVDIGHVEVEGLTFPGAIHNAEKQTSGSKNGSKGHKVKANTKVRHHFLLMAGLGIDAAIMGHVSKPLKYQIGPLAVGISAAKELPKQHPFPVEIRAAGSGRDGDLLWKGEALQIIIGNTRKYAEVLEITPGAYIDDGVLDVRVIIAGNPLTTLGQITSLLLRRKPDNLTTEYFHGAHITISAPASVAMQLDGSAVKLKDYLSKSDRKALGTADAEQVMVHYRFDAMPRALHAAIPNTYNDILFEHTSDEGKSHAVREHVERASEEKVASKSYEHTYGVESKSETQHLEENTSQHNGEHATEEEKRELPELVARLMERECRVAVVGVSPNPDKHNQTYIVAGGTHKKSTGEIKPVAVRIDDNTIILRHSGEDASFAVVGDLREGAEIVVEGKQSKHGVISAKRVVV